MNPRASAFVVLNLLKINRKNKVSYHVFMLLLLAHEVHMRNQEPRTNKSDWSIRISYALKANMDSQQKLVLSLPLLA